MREASFKQWLWGAFSTSAPTGRLLSLSLIWEVIPRRSRSDSVVTTYKIFQFSGVESVLASVDLHLSSDVCTPVRLWRPMCVPL